MNSLETVQRNGVKIAIVHSNKICIKDEQSALDFIMSVEYQTGTRSIVLNSEALTPDFFILSTRIAGQILQKVIMYQFSIAIVGDFSKFKSKPLRDFIYESNKGKNIFFVASEEEAIEKLSKSSGNPSDSNSSKSDE